MESMKSKLADLSRLNWKIILRAALALLVLILIVFLCISRSNAADMQKKYSTARAALGESLYGALNQMALEYDDAALIGSDIEGTILPNMQTDYAQARALNLAMAQAFGEKYAVMDGDLEQELDQAFEAYDAALRGGHSTAEADALMQQAVADVRAALDKRYHNQTGLR